MESSERKLASELRRWVQADTPGKQTVLIRLAFSQDPEAATETLDEMGMTIQSSGPSLVVAVSNRESIIRASQLSWVVKIDFPQQLNMKSMLHKM